MLEMENTNLKQNDGEIQTERACFEERQKYLHLQIDALQQNWQDVIYCKYVKSVIVFTVVHLEYP